MESTTPLLSSEKENGMADDSSESVDEDCCADNDDNNTSEYGSTRDKSAHLDNAGGGKRGKKLRRKPSKFIQSKKNSTIMSAIHIVAILAPSFAYGCIMSTLFLLTLPMECQRIEASSPPDGYVSKSIALGLFSAIAGVTQLVSPLAGMLSDHFKPALRYTEMYRMGRRIPYMLLGTFLMIFGLLGQIYCSKWNHMWIRYSLFFFVTMIGINILYTIMTALMPDLVPDSQTGMANGSLALLLVSGSLFGFGMFHFVFFANNTDQDGDVDDSSVVSAVGRMYELYIAVCIGAMAITYVSAKNRETFLRESVVDAAEILGPKEVEEVGVVVEAKEEGEETEFETDSAKVTESLLLQQQQVRQRQDNNEQLKEEEEELDGWPPIHSFFWMLLYKPLDDLECAQIRSAYWVDPNSHFDFFIVTVSRLFYYMGISSQTFFLYFVHDAIHMRKNPEAAVASLAIVGQIFGAITCYPVGIISDRFLGGRRKPFVYFACVVLSCGNLSLLWCTTFHQAVIVMSVLGAANGIYLTMDTSLAVDTLPADLKDGPSSQRVTTAEEGEENRQGDDKKGGDGGGDGSAQLLGVWGVAGFLGSALGPLVGGPMLYFFGKTTNSDNNDSDSPPEDFNYYNLYGYTILFSLSAVYFFCSAVSLKFVRNPNV